MHKALRAGLYVLTSEQGKSAVIKIIAAFMCLLTFAFVMLQGFVTSYLTVFGGGNDDIYAQAVDSVKNELKIENTLDPSILRAIYFNKNQSTEADIDDVITTIKTYFVESEEIQRTIQEEDILNLQGDIEKINNDIEREKDKLMSDADKLTELQKRLDELSDKLANAEKTYEEESGYKYYFVSSDKFNEIVSKEPFNLSNEDINEINNYLLLAGTYGSKVNVDLSDLTFDNEIVNDQQKSLVLISLSAADYGIHAYNNQCEAWVEDVYQMAGYRRSNSHCAVCAGNKFGVSSDWTKIQVGATVYGTASQQFGHVGIYIGNGQVIHNLNGIIKKQSLESWINTFNGKCWGWDNGNNLSKNPIYNCVGGLM